MILGLLLLAIIKRDNLVVAYAGLRGNQRVPVKERNEPELSTNKQAMSVYSPTQTNSEKHIKTSLTRTEEEMFNTIEIDKGNVDCNEIGLVFEDADDGSKGKGPVRIKLGYNSKLGTDNVIKINLIIPQNNEILLVYLCSNNYNGVSSDFMQQRYRDSTSR